MPGARVLMYDGTLVAIENVKKGDLIRTKEGNITFVKDTFIYNIQGLKQIYSKDKLQVTNTHPLYIDGKWSTADELNWDNEIIFVEKLYNLETEDNFIIEGIAASGTTHEHLDVVVDSDGYSKIIDKKEKVY